jgi:hypothetical protein
MAPSDQSDAQELAHWDPDPRQLDMFGPPPTRNYDSDPEDVRAELAEILARVRAAPQVPWPGKEMAYWRTVFPQMAKRLPAEEAAQLRLEFAAELARLEAP